MSELLNNGFTCSSSIDIYTPVSIYKAVQPKKGDIINQGDFLAYHSTTEKVYVITTMNEINAYLYLMYRLSSDTSLYALM